MTPTPSQSRSRRRGVLAALAAIATLGILLGTAAPASAANYTRISGEGSSWAGNAWLDFLSNAASQGVTVDYNPNGSSVGRNDFAQQINASFADSEIPFTGDASDPQDKRTPNFKYSQLPIVAGGTAFMYNLPIAGSRYTGLKLSMAAIAGIFTGVITRWNDPAIAVDNPGVALPAQQITVVVRSDGSGATAQFKLWLLRQFPADYKKLTAKTGEDPNHASSYYPVDNLKNFTAQTGSSGVTTYTQNTEYSIDYDEYSYALQAGYPVAKVKNAAGFYTLPTDKAVAVALVKANINNNPKDPNYLSQDLSQVYTYKDPRSYPMSMYSYLLIPEETNAVVTAAKGATLAWLSHNAVCEWQRDMGNLGYSPLPMNLVLAGLDQITHIPGIDAATSGAIASTRKGVLQGGTNPCNNPTFKPGDSVDQNVLVETAPFPAGCDAACQKDWTGRDTATASGPKYQNTSKNAGGGAAAGGGGKGGGSAKAPSDAAAPTASAASGGAKTCDPDTGACTDASTVVAAGAAKAVPLVVSADNGWAGPQTLMVLAGLLTFAFLLAPPVVSRLLARARASAGRRR